VRVLLVGAGGFIGRHVAAALTGAGHAVTTLSRAPAGGGSDHLCADRRDATALAKALGTRPFDLTVDLVAFDGDDVETLLGPYGAQLGRYVLVSTGQVYLVANERRDAWREHEAGLPAMPAPPPGSRDHGQWTYGMGKRRAEAAVRAHAGVVPGVTLRLPIVQGAGDHSARLWAWLARMLDGGPVLLPEGGRQPTRFVWAGDVGRAVVQIATRWPEGTAYNLAQPDVVPLRMLLERAAALAGVAPRFEDVAAERLAEAGLDPAAFPFTGAWSSVLDPGRAREALGFEGTPHDRWLPIAVRWHLETRPPHHPGYAQRARERAFVPGAEARR
jgi:nucleoside-diphosphate-sugar epimerase